MFNSVLFKLAGNWASHRMDSLKEHLKANRPEIVQFAIPTLTAAALFANRLPRRIRPPLALVGGLTAYMIGQTNQGPENCSLVFLPLLQKQEERLQVLEKQKHEIKLLKKQTDQLLDDQERMKWKVGSLEAKQKEKEKKFKFSEFLSNFKLP